MLRYQGYLISIIFLLLCKVVWALPPTSLGALPDLLKAECEATLSNIQVSGRGAALASNGPAKPTSWTMQYPDLYQALTTVDAKLFQLSHADLFAGKPLAQAYQQALDLRADIVTELLHISETLPLKSEARLTLQHKAEMLRVETLPRGWVNIASEDLFQMAVAIRQLPKVLKASSEYHSRKLIRRIFKDTVNRGNLRFDADDSRTHGPFTLVLEPVFEALGSLLVATRQPAMNSDIWNVLQSRPTILQFISVAPRWRHFSRLRPASTSSLAYYWPDVYNQVSYIEENLFTRRLANMHLDNPVGLVRQINEDCQYLKARLAEILSEVAQHSDRQFAPAVRSMLTDMIDHVMRYQTPQAWLEMSAEQLTALLKQNQQLYNASADWDVKNGFKYKIEVLVCLLGIRPEDFKLFNNHSDLKEVTSGHLRSLVGELLVIFRVKNVAHRNVRVGQMMNLAGITAPEAAVVDAQFAKLRERQGAPRVDLANQREIDLITGSVDSSWVEIKTFNEVLDMRRKDSNRMDKLVNQLSALAFLQSFLRKGITIPGRTEPVEIIPADASRLFLYLPMGITDETSQYLIRRLGYIMRSTNTKFEIHGPVLPVF